MTALKKYIGDSQNLMKSDAFWESVGHRYPQSVFEVVENLEIKNYNEHFLSMIGAKRQNLTTTDWFNFVRSQDLEKFLEIINYVFDKFSSRTARTLFVHSTGEVIWTNCQFIPCEDKHGTRSVLIMIMDQTHQHHLNEKLYLLNSQLEQINDENYLGAFQYYPDSHKVTFDNVWVNMTLGYKVNDLRIRNNGLSTILSQTDYPIFINWLETIQTYNTKSIKVHFIDATGEPRATLCGAKKKVNAGIETVYVWCKDISKNEDLENRVKELEFSDMQSDKMAFIGEMTNEITHELGNNIMSVSLILDLIKIKKDKNILKNEDYDRLLSVVDKSTHRMKNIITGVKHFSYTTDGAQFSNTPLKELVEEIQLFYSSVLNADFFELSVEFDQLVSSHINCEPSYLIQGLMNLIKNAIDENKSLEKPWVKVVILENEKHFQFKVIDSGSGIPLELREKIFKQHFTTKEKGKGNGIGLSVANKVAKTHDGRFFLDTLAKNTTFVIEIPKTVPINWCF